jgi:hypothetical protein
MKGGREGKAGDDQSNEPVTRKRNGKARVEVCLSAKRDPVG